MNAPAMRQCVCGILAALLLITVVLTADEEARR